MYLILYDISNPKRLKRVAKNPEPLWKRIQKSAYECEIGKYQFEELGKSFSRSGITTTLSPRTIFRATLEAIDCFNRLRRIHPLSLSTTQRINTKKEKIIKNSKNSLKKTLSALS